jgi:predicted transposase/invertase (TIGR01784 family)
MVYLRKRALKKLYGPQAGKPGMYGKRFYPPRFDYVFKRIFGEQRNIRVLAAFLMAALDLSGEDFDDLTIVDPHLKREFNDDKMGILDVNLRRRDNTSIGIEIQVKITRDLRKRIAFNSAKMLTGQLRRGKGYASIEPAVSIVICGDVLLPDEPEYYNRYGIRNVRSGREFVDLLQINILEPAKLPEEPDGKTLFNWGRFFKATTPEELAMTAERDPAIAEAVGLVMKLNEDEEERLLAEKRWRWQMEQAAREQDSYENGLAEGEKKSQAIYQPVIEEKDREIRAIKQEIEELRRKLQEAGGNVDSFL